jgi:hypothetical protein
MRVGVRISALAAFACGLLACGSVALAVAAGTKPVPTKVTIKPPNSKTTTLHGKVYSTNTSCWTRTIDVHQIQGPAQNPSKDRIIATTTSKAGHGNGFWKLSSNPHPGRYYARATKKPGCKPGSSKLIHFQ